MDQVVLEVDLHLVNNIRICYYIVSNSVEPRVLMNKIDGILSKRMSINLTMEKKVTTVFQLKK